AVGPRAKDRAARGTSRKAREQVERLFGNRCRGGEVMVSGDVERAALATAETDEPSLPGFQPELSAPAQDAQIGGVVVRGAQPARLGGFRDDARDGTQIRGMELRSGDKGPSLSRRSGHTVRCARASASSSSRFC